VVEPRYHVVNVDDLAVHAGLSAASQSEAYALKADAIARDPGLQGTLQVVADFELAA
jgi:hypothetical protein